MPSELAESQQYVDFYNPEEHYFRYFQIVGPESLFGDQMPSIQVYWWEGRDKEAKRKVIEGITRVFEDVGIPAEATTVIINDIPRGNWGLGGKQASEME